MTETLKLPLNHKFNGGFLLIIITKNKNMKPIYNLLIALLCYVFILYHYIYNFNIITHPYMFFLIITLFGVGGYNFGVALGKFINKKL